MRAERKVVCMESTVRCENEVRMEKKVQVPMAITLYPAVDSGRRSESESAAGATVVAVRTCNFSTAGTGVTNFSAQTCFVVQPRRRRHI